MLKRLRDLFGGKTVRDESPAEGPEAAPPPQPAPAPHAVHHGPAVVHRPIREDDLDPDAVRIVRRLTRFDHTAYLVGGCVRDLLLERRPKDFDVGTSATPRQIKRVFSNCRIIGRRFRLAHIYFQNGKIIEVATFRARDVQGEALDEASAPEASEDLLIRDDNVFGTPEEDALRRDFTINALFYDVNAGNVIDHADGLGDLRRRLVRTIGDPEVRFREDPIRILRAIKFAARLDFEIEDRTRDALVRTRGEIPKAATPRVLEEINRFCRAGAGRRSFELMFETGVFDVVVPEFAKVYGAGREDARTTLLALLRALDAREDVTEVSAGDIFACLVAPLVLEEVGWLPAGPGRPQGHVNPRDASDAWLRPVALRLRMSRRDQERCRQTIATLQRLAPVRAMKRGVRQALRRRPAFAEALAILRVLADLWGGEYGEAYAWWASAEPAAQVAAERAPELRPAEEGATEPGSGRRRRRRRGGRGRRPVGETVSGAAPESYVAPPRAAAPAEARPPRHAAPTRSKPKLPAVWDDDYFFAALPSVPDLGREEGDTDRYGARALATAKPIEETLPNGAPAPDAPPAPKGAPRKRRRRGGRGPRREQGPGGTAGPAPASDPD